MITRVSGIIILIIISLLANTAFADTIANRLGFSGRIGAAVPVESDSEFINGTSETKAGFAANGGLIYGFGDYLAAELDVTYLPKLDVETVRKYMIVRGTLRQRSSTWLSFLRNHLQVSWAIDFFTVTTVGFGQLYVFVVLEHGRRHQAAESSGRWEPRGFRRFVVFSRAARGGTPGTQWQGKGMRRVE